MMVALRRPETNDPVCGNCWEFYQRTCVQQRVIDGLYCIQGKGACAVELMRTGQDGLLNDRNGDIIILHVSTTTIINISLFIGVHTQ
jgi:hypothetical protein